MFPDPQPYFLKLDDPRRETKNKLHKLGDILFIALAAVLSGIEDWANMEEWARRKEAWLRQYLELPNGIPSHDTISDVFSRLNFKQFSLAFVEWVEASLPTLNGQHIAIDGKTLRGSRDSEGADHVVGAFASAGRWALAQEAVREKSNEIDAIPRLLSLLEIKGATITIDAMGCQRGIAEVIVAAEADYILALKDNQPSLYADAQAKIDAAVEAATLPIHRTLDKDHGRIETRRYCILTDLTGIAGAQKWKGLKGIGMVESSREIIGKETTVERRYYICSNPDLPHFAEHVRSHWAIEAHHWILDVQFGEDKNRTRKDFSAKNLAVVRRMALNFLHADKDEKDKRSIRTRKMIALLDDNYRTALLSRAA